MNNTHFNHSTPDDFGGVRSILGMGSDSEPGHGSGGRLLVGGVCCRTCVVPAVGTWVCAPKGGGSGAPTRSRNSGDCLNGSNRPALGPPAPPLRSSPPRP